MHLALRATLGGAEADRNAATGMEATSKISPAVHHISGTVVAAAVTLEARKCEQPRLR